MNIFLGVIGELVTVIGSLVIPVKFVNNSVIKFAERGYKIDRSVVAAASEKSKQENGVKKAIGKILLFVPGINLVKSGIECVQQDSLYKKALIPMSDKEKMQYKQAKGKRQKLKLLYTTFYPTKNDGEENEEVFVETLQSYVDNTINETTPTKIPIRYDYSRYRYPCYNPYNKVETKNKVLIKEYK